MGEAMTARPTARQIAAAAIARGELVPATLPRPMEHPAKAAGRNLVSRATGQNTFQ